MKAFFFLTVSCLFPLAVKSQKVIPLESRKIPDVNYSQPEKQYFSEAWQTEVITNVSEPQLLAFEAKGKNSGTAVIIAPGGGLYAHSINSEGIDVAKWLSERGITAFVLKYRLVPTEKDGSAEFGARYGSHPQEVLDKVSKVLPYSIEDGLKAVKYVRSNAAKYGINPNKIGFMGFSAGGAVTMGVGYEYQEDSRPNFLVPVYPWTTAYPVKSAPKDAPDILIVCATDDGLGLAAGSIDLYGAWYQRGKNVSLHMYARGGHGFGMKKQHLPSDHWIERFLEWAVAEKLVTY